MSKSKQLASTAYSPNAVTFIALIGVAVGTGGLLLIGQSSEQKGAMVASTSLKTTSTTYDLSNFKRAPSQDIFTKGAAENLVRIREVFNPGVSALAEALRVSRQAIYNWAAGEPPSTENFARLEDLANAADLAATVGLKFSGQLLKQKIVNGKNFFEIIKEGSSAQEVVKTLINRANVERNQKDRLNQRLKGRSISPIDPRYIGSQATNDIS